MDALADTGAVRMFFALGAAHLMDVVAEVPAEVVSVDWRTDLAHGARATAGPHAARQSRSGGAVRGSCDARGRGAADLAFRTRRRAHLQPRSRDLARHADRRGGAADRHGARVQARMSDDSAGARPRITALVGELQEAICARVVALEQRQAGRPRAAARSSSTRGRVRPIRNASAAAVRRASSRTAPSSKRAASTRRS